MTIKNLPDLFCKFCLLCIFLAMIVISVFLFRPTKSEPIDNPQIPIQVNINNEVVSYVDFR